MERLARALGVPADVLERASRLLADELRVEGIARTALARRRDRERRHLVGAVLAARQVQRARSTPEP